MPVGLLDRRWSQTTGPLKYEFKYREYVYTIIRKRESLFENNSEVVTEFAILKATGKLGIIASDGSQM
jgi:hypothetical protein